MIVPSFVIVKKLYLGNFDLFPALTVKDLMLEQYAVLSDDPDLQCGEDRK